MRSSFRVKMTIGIVLVVLVSSGLISWFGYRKAKKSMSIQLEEKYNIAADKYAMELSAWINKRATIIDTMAAEIAEGAIYDRTREDFHRYLFQNCTSLNADGSFYDIYFTYPDNTMACASDFEVDGTVDYVNERDWYKEAVGTRKLYYSSPYMDSDTKLPIITISKAIYDGLTLKGVLAADIFVDTLVDMINEADVAPDSYAFLVDQNMGMIVHPYEGYKYDDRPVGILQIPGAHYAEVISAIRNDSDETIYVKDYDGVTRGITVAKMANTGWYVGIATNKAELMKDVGGLLRVFILIAGVAIVLGCLFAVILALVLDKYSKQQQEYQAQVLRLEKQAADEASQAKSRFLADMSHEIRTPINAILGMNEMILRETEDKDIMGYSRNIKQSGQNLLQLVNSILDFSKIEDGKMEILPGRYSVKSLMLYVVNAISERARAKDLDLRLEIDPTIPSELFGDDMKIGEIIMNLLTNAVKYTEQGSVTLTVKNKERKAGTEPSVLLYVEVKDTGIGIKESDMPRLFESFARLDEERNRHIEGTGLGIAITTKLLKMMDSELKVESTYGEGSRFYFELWQKIENEEPMGEFGSTLQNTSSAPKYKESFQAPQARILIVDDTKLNITVAVNFLKKTRVKIDTALSGSEAIQLASENAYDLILMDQRMPEMDGTEAMKKIRALENKKNETTPVICLTADVIRGARERYLAEGFDDYLTKPVDADELEQMLLTYLPKEKIRKASEKEETKEEENAASDSPILLALSRAGIDTRSGMFFCQNDEEMYKAVLAEYCAEEKTKSLHLRNCFERKDWKNYEIYVHSLKSTSKTIGAAQLSERAAKLEGAAGRQEEMTLEEEHELLMKMYQEIVRVIEEQLGISDASINEESEVFEFLPEEDLD